ncbi:GTPase ObgE [candidate division KSB1 bacterium]|nr:GTPase ObgE [candidate division KSB1 bacterium]
MTFIDSAQIVVKAGDGGNGCLAFRREKYVPKGGPSGGDGGDGGSVIVQADSHIHTLLDFKYQRSYAAQRGQHGEGDNKTGRNGRDVIIRLPVGTVVRDAADGSVLADLVEDGQQAIVARGGHGGRGNARFATPTNRAPRHFETGYPGEEHVIDLELKLLADIGLVGLPNAGKSTLLSRISAARPKIADYPFTTLIPNLGLVRVDSISFVVADIPGLIQGAHSGKGLGTQFLRHIERTRAIALLMDATSDDPAGDYLTLLQELRAYGQDLLQKPRILVFTKLDLVEDSIPSIPDEVLGDVTVLGISAVSGKNIEALLHRLAELFVQGSAA